MSKNKNSLIYGNIIIGILMVLCFILHEYFRFYIPDYIYERSILKGLLSLVPVGIMIVHIRKNTIESKTVSIGLLMATVVCLIGDVFINYQGVVGLFIYMLGQMIFVAVFIKKKRPSKIAFGIWLLWVACILILGYFLYEKPILESIIILGGMLYLSIMSLMVISSLGYNKYVFVGGFLFGVSDLLLAYNFILGETILMHILSLGLYYIGITMIAIFSAREIFMME